MVAVEEGATVADCSEKRKRRSIVEDKPFADTLGKGKILPSRLEKYLTGFNNGNGEKRRSSEALSCQAWLLFSSFLISVLNPVQSA